MSTCLQDIRYALRGFRKAPLFTAIAIVTIALGVGANTAIFSVVNGVILSALPYPNADEIVSVWPEKVFSEPMLAEVKEETSSFRYLSGYTSDAFTLTGESEPEVLAGAVVSADFFAALGVVPAIGRVFREEEQLAARDGVVILGHGLWQRRYGGDPAIVGKTINLDGRGFSTRTVVGVMPEAFQSLMGDGMVFVPLMMDSAATNYSGSYGLRVIARLVPGVTIERARTDLKRLVASFKDKYPTQFRQIRLSPVPVISLQENIIRDVRSTLLIMLGAVGLVLVIACANVANLLLARSGAREREFAIRMAVGAGRGRIIRQLLTESVLLAALGGVAGLGIAWATTRVMAGNLPIPRSQLVGIDFSVFTFALAVSIVAGLIFGIVPALRTARSSAQLSLRSENRSLTSSRGRHRINNALVMGEIALAVVLVIGAGLMLKSFVQMRQVPLGFDETNLLILRPMPPATRYADDARVAYYNELRERVAVLPGVTDVALVSLVPMTGSNSGIPYLVAGQDLPRETVSQVVNFRRISMGYFRTMRIPLLRGRVFQAGDAADGDPVGIVNQRFVQKHFPEEDPIGKQILTSGGNPLLTIVGVVRDIQQHRLDLEPRPQLYVSHAQFGVLFPRLLVRTDGEPLSMTRGIKDAIWQGDKDVPVIQIRTMQEVIRESLGNSRFLTILFASFAFLAFVLGVVGVYGVMSFIVGQQVKEIGIRMALGATGSDIKRRTLARGVVTTGVGVVAGLTVSLVVTRLIESLLFNVTSLDPLIFVVVPLSLLGVGILANYMPARRAARTSPMNVLTDG